jgi:hypothetical protein
LNFSGITSANSSRQPAFPANKTPDVLIWPHESLIEPKNTAVAGLIQANSA